MQPTIKVNLPVTTVKLYDDSKSEVITLEFNSRLTANDCKNLAKDKGFKYLSKQHHQKIATIETQAILDNALTIEVQP